MPKWLTSEGFFSVQSGWSMLSTRVRPRLYNDSEGYTRIRRLLLDLARGPSEISKGLQDAYRYGTGEIQDGEDNLNDELDSNRLDPYQVGITILSAYSNYSLRIFSDLNPKWEHVSLRDCIQACVFESRLFSDKNQGDKFMKYILDFLVFIRDHKSSSPDHKLLVNRILSFCSIARISPPREPTNNIETTLKNYFSQKGRLIQISLKEIHKAANFLSLNQKLKWGWSVVVTVCFEKAIDQAYSDTNKVFGGKAWLMSRTPGRALFFHQDSKINLEMHKNFIAIFKKIFIETISNYCKEVGTKESIDIQKEIYSTEQISMVIDKLVQFNDSGTTKPLHILYQKKNNVKPTQTVWGINLEQTPLWAQCLKFPAARGVRRFRLIQSLWQDLISLRGKQKQTKVRPQKEIAELSSFVYLDCIQLGDLIWEGDNWLQCFEKARIIAPLIEGVLAGFISAFDTLYPEFADDKMEFGPKALGGDELHIIVPGGVKEVKNVVKQLNSQLIKHVSSYGLVHFSEWKSQRKRNESGRLVMKRSKREGDKFRPLCPKQMWWLGIIQSGNNFEEDVEYFSQQISKTKDFKRSRWSSTNSLFQYM